MLWLLVYVVTQMKSFIVYEMIYKGETIHSEELKMISFEEKYYPQYEKIYNECFYDMRKALEIEPCNFYSDISQLKDKMSHIFLLLENNVIIGSVSCLENEIDDLIVNKLYQKRGYGIKILIWAINNIRKYSNKDILLHVAEWNKTAVMIYKKIGFEIKNIEIIN